MKTLSLLAATALTTAQAADNNNCHTPGCKIATLQINKQLNDNDTLSKVYHKSIQSLTNETGLSAQQIINIWQVGNRYTQKCNKSLNFLLLSSGYLSRPIREIKFMEYSALITIHMCKGVTK